MKENFSPSSDLLQFIAKMALVGIEKGHFSEAQFMLKTVVDLCPNNLDAKIVQAMSEIMMGHLTLGVTSLMNLLKQDPKNERIKGFLALAFQIVGAKKEAQSLAEHILEHCKDTTTLSMADAVLKAQEESISPHDLQAKQCQHMNKEAYVH